MTKRILIIEDDKDIVEAVRYNLEKEKGFSVRAARSGEEGLEAAFELKPQLIILDIGLPGFNGYELCRPAAAGPADARSPDPDADGPGH